MPRYRFSVQNITRRIFKDTGAVELLDDASARAYGQRVIEELNRDETSGYFGWTMDIKEGDRLIAIIPFNKPLCVPNIRFSMDAENRRGKFAT